MSDQALSNVASAPSNEDVETALGANDAATDQYLTFIMANEEYGVDILSVQEIRGWEAATPIPNSPDFVKGVINLRGTIVPIIDLRLRFGLNQADYGPMTVVIVLKVANDKGNKVIGIVVDAVSDVYSLSSEDMRQPPEMGDQVNTSFIKGLVDVQGKMVILLNIDVLLNLKELPDVDTLKKIVTD
ncbi:chemotaxis protein CheW [Litoribrevibacter albus]|uniref:Chemotaxis protein CheW n=1 Tax=Litoribrevibacter albus TaxID=1473156 RepID=A0AA37W7A3_9GAMM|nr:chemotaxis protein CheW [Litoribrevibacter albus]GLQ32335.1 chemotaxis protein CheW [Litoribrevibacter albus]